MAKTIQEPIKTDGLLVVQRNYIENKMAREKAEERQLELAVRDACATEYRLDCKRRRKQAIKDRLYAISIGVVCAGLLFALVSCSETENRYAIAREQGNGIHYVYVTERKCEVTEVTDNCVYVDYKGNEYSFSAYNTELEVGDEIICKFTDNWEIIGTK